MSTIANINTVFGADTTGFDKGAKKISRGTKKLAKEMRKSRSFMKGDAFGVASMKTAGIAIAGLATGLVAYSRSLAGAMDETAKFSRRIGVNVEEMQKLQLVNTMAGESSGTLSNGLQKMQKALNEASEGTKTYTDIFDRLGLSVEDMMEMTPDKQLRTIAKSMDGMKNSTVATATAMELFGTRGAGLINTMKGLDKELKKIESNEDIMKGILSADQIRRFEEVNDQFAQLDVIMRGSIADNMEQINALVRGFATISAGAFEAWRKGAEWVERTSLQIQTNSKDRRLFYRIRAESDLRAEIRAEKLLALEKKQTAEAKKQAKLDARKMSDQKSFAQIASALLASELTEKQKLFKEYNKLIELQKKTGAFGPNAEKAIRIMQKRIDDIVTKEKEAAQKKLELAKKEALVRKKAIEEERIAQEKKAALTKLDDKIEAQKNKVDALKEGQIKEQKIGFAGAISKGVTSKGLASGGKQINEKQYDIMKKQLEIAENTLIELKKERSNVAG